MKFYIASALKSVAVTAGTVPWSGTAAAAPLPLFRMRKRDEIETLLPWYAAGTLSRSDADRVEQALASDQELAQCFDLIRRELAETVDLNETLGAPSPRAAAKLFAAIDAEEAQLGGPRRQRLDQPPHCSSP
jgi:anti-sigma factor RsiW